MSFPPWLLTVDHECDKDCEDKGAKEEDNHQRLKNDQVPEQVQLLQVCYPNVAEKKEADRCLR